MTHSASPSSNRARNVARRMHREARRKAKVGALCAECGAGFDLSLKGDHPRAVSADHVVPRCQDGPDIESNILPMHVECNRAKGVRDRAANRERQL